MPFPFIAQIKPWIKKKLEKREQFSYENFRLSPFVIMSSGAVVLKTAKGANIPNIIKNKVYDGAFKGCVISNQSELPKLESILEAPLFNEFISAFHYIDLNNYPI